jgi:hypothetical protein
VATDGLIVINSLNQGGLIVGWACATANVADNTFQRLVRQFEDQMIVLRDMAFHATESDPSNLKLCPRGEWEDRILVKTVEFIPIKPLAAMG